MTGYIYRIRNLINGKFYIGSTRQNPPRNRWTTGHVRDFRNGKHDNQRLQHSWNKHGEKAFVFEIVDTLIYNEDVELEQREQEWIDRTNPQYNICRKVVRNEWGVKKASEVNSKEYVVTSPDGKEMRIKNLLRFCQENNLNETCMWAVATGRGIQHRGWLCRHGNMSAEQFELIRKKKRPLIIKESRTPKVKISKPHSKTRKAVRNMEVGPKKTKYNPNGLFYAVVSPDGTEYTCNDLTSFAKMKELSYSGLRSVLYGRMSHSRGWKVRYEGKDFLYKQKTKGHGKTWFVKNVETNEISHIYNLKHFASDRSLRNDHRYKELRKGDVVYKYSEFEDFRDVPVKPGKAKGYLITRADNTQVSIYGLRRFCRKEGLDVTWSKRLSDCALGKLKSYKGWTAKFI